MQFFDVMCALASVGTAAVKGEYSATVVDNGQSGTPLHVVDIRDGSLDSLLRRPVLMVSSCCLLLE
jgi:hypothetical protein